jgi:protein-S-isoprenylcysteine O-methyltransferase Ste14
VTGSPACGQRKVNFELCFGREKPSLDQQKQIHTIWECAVQNGIGSEDKFDDFSTCTYTKLNPTLLDGVQDSYSKAQFGAFSGPLFIIIALWIMVRFGLTTLLHFDKDQTQNASVTIDNATKRPQIKSPEKSWMTAQALKLAIAVVWDVIILAVVLGVSYPMSGTASIPAISTQGTLYCVLFVVLDMVYLASDIMADIFGPNDEQTGSKLGRRAYVARAKKDIFTTMARGYNMVSPAYTYQPISATYAVQTAQPSVPESSAEMYAINGITLTDCWVLCEPLFVVGVVGCLQFARTVDIVQLFWLAVYYSLINACYTRLLYAGYVHDSNTNDTPTSWRKNTTAVLKDQKNNIALLIRSMAIMAKAAAAFIAVCVFFVFFFRYQKSPESGAAIAYFSLEIVALVVSMILLAVYDMSPGTTAGEFMLTAKSEYLFQFFYKSVIAGVILLNPTSRWADGVSYLHTLQADVYSL